MSSPSTPRTPPNASPTRSMSRSLPLHGRQPVRNDGDAETRGPHSWSSCCSKNAAPVLIRRAIEDHSLLASSTSS